MSVNVGRTGAVTPFAELEPVFIAGTTVSMATLHNANEVARKDIRDGDRVIVEKAGDIIPQVVRVVNPDREDRGERWQMPANCPRCQSALVRGEDEAVWRCENTSCPAKLQRGLEHFAARHAMNIEGLGESRIALLIAGGLVASYADVYRLTAERLEPIERMGKKSAANLVEQIERSKTRDFWRLIFGLGIRHVGERGAQALAGAFGTMDALLAASKEQLQAVPDIGPVVAAAVREYLDQPQNRALIKELAAAGLKMDAPMTAASAPGPLSGKTFVLTGTLPTMSREAGHRSDPGARRKGDRLGEQEDRPRRCRCRSRQQARKGRVARHFRPRRGSVPEASRLIILVVFRPFALVTLALTAVMAFLLGLTSGSLRAPGLRQRHPRRWRCDLRPPPDAGAPHSVIAAADARDQSSDRNRARTREFCRRRRESQSGGRQHRGHDAGGQPPEARGGAEPVR